MIVEDGANTCSVTRSTRFLDLAIRRNGPTITNENCSGQFQFKHHPHLGLEPDNYVERSDINDIISIKLLLFVHSGRRSLTALKLDELVNLLFTLNVSTGTSFLGCQIGEERLNIRQRGLVD